MNFHFKYWETETFDLHLVDLCVQGEWRGCLVGELVWALGTGQCLEYLEWRAAVLIKLWRRLRA